MTPAVRIANDLFERHATGRVLVVVPGGVDVEEARAATESHWRATKNALGAGLAHRMPYVTREEEEGVDRREREMNAARFVLAPAPETPADALCVVFASSRQGAFTLVYDFVDA